MIETLLITTLIIAICMAFLLVKVLFKRNGEFSSQHIHDSQAMKDRGIHCVTHWARITRASLLFSFFPLIRFCL